MIAPLGRQPAIETCAWRGDRVAVRGRVHGALTAIVVLQLLLSVVTEADELAEPAEKQAFALNSAQGLLSANHTSKFLGARSCAATACHGGIAADPRYPLSQRNEYVFWLDHDPHARAHRTLSNERSRSILKRLARANESGEVQARRLANCFGCHNPQPAPDQQAATFYPRDGVSCESCHGAAEQWIGAHVSADWRKAKTNDPEAWRVRAAGLGFMETESLLVRGQTCAQCHVGSPGREVNHDLIAAGHPVLKFELAAYHELLPKHWRSSVEREGNAEFEVELWSAGQVTAADAALELLRWRSQNVADKHPDTAWPELAEYDCFACHHDLEDPSWRRQRTLAGLPLGMPAWGTWYFGPLRQMYESETDVGSSFKALGDQMHRGFGGNQQDVTTAVKAARNQLASLVNTESLAGLGKRMRSALRQLEREHQTADNTDNAQPRSWDEAVQLYLAIVAMDHAAENIDSNTMATTRKLFSFPDGYDSPRGFFGERVPPASETALRDARPRSRREIVKALLDLIRQLETGN